MITVLFILFIKVHSDEGHTPQLRRLYTQENNDPASCTIRLTFSASRGHICYIYKRIPGGKYFLAGHVISGKGITEYTERNVGYNMHYTYTVRQRGRWLYRNRLSGYDHDGISIIDGTPSVIASSGNLNSRIRWSINSEADGYRIYRRMENGRWILIGTVPGTETTFTDVYSKTFSPEEKKQYLGYGCYLDTSSHTVSYTVRAIRRSNTSDKMSLSPYQKDGYFNLNAPLIVDFNDTTYMNAHLTFTSVPYASLYRIQLVNRDRSGEVHYHTYLSVHGPTDPYISCDVPVKPGYDYCINAYAVRNGRQITKRSAVFTLKYRSSSSHNILYIGDSITYGSPYKTDLTRYIFSYPWRVSQLTGASYYNAAIPGATLSYSNRNRSSFHRYRIITDVLPALTIGTTPSAGGLLRKNDETLEDFDTIVILAGTNDYTDMIPIGSTDSYDITNYCGALNTLLTQIMKASARRVYDGKDPVSVVMPDLFYSDRCRNFTRKQSRFRTKNGLGYTLLTYSRAGHEIEKKFRERGMIIYRFRTSGFVNEKNCPYTTADNLHMTRYTYEKIGNSLTDFLVKKVWKD